MVAYFALLAIIYCAALAGALDVRVDARNLTSSDGTRIYAEAVGSPSNPPLLWIHGNSFSGIIFDKQFNDPALTDSFYQVRMDLRGMGRSAKPEGSESEDGWLSEKQADDVKAVIDAFGLVRPVVIAWSYGANIVGDYLSYYPVESLAGVVFTGGVIGTPDTLARYLLIPPEVWGQLVNINGISSEVNQAISHFVWLSSYKPLDVWDFHAMKGIMLGTDNEARFWSLQRDIDGSGIINANATLPLFLLFGRHDALVRPAYVEDFVKSGNWSADLLATHFIEETGHTCFWEKPRDFNDALKGWVESLLQL